MSPSIDAIISYSLITGIPIVLIWCIYWSLRLFHRYSVFYFGCNSCGHRHHEFKSPLVTSIYNMLDFKISSDSSSCNYNMPPVIGKCGKCKHDHIKHTLDRCSGEVSNLEQSTFSTSKPHLINPNSYKIDDNGIAVIQGREVYIHTTVKEVEVDEKILIGHKSVECIELTHVPTGQKQKRIIKKTRTIKKQVPVEKIRKVKRNVSGSRPRTETSTTHHYGMIQPSTSKSVYTQVPVNVWNGTGYRTEYRTSERVVTTPSTWGWIPSQTTQTRQVQDFTIEEVDEKYTDVEWKDVDEEYDEEIDVDIMEEKYIQKIRQQPIYETKKVIKKQEEYVFSCACKRCSCPQCVYKKCSCNNCSCSHCTLKKYSIYITVFWPIITTLVFMGIISIVLGVESMIHGWNSLTIHYINFGFVFIILGISFLLSLVIVAIWFRSNYHNVVTGYRTIVISIMMLILITVELTTVCVFATIPIIVWKYELNMDVVFCYIVDGILLFLYSIGWIFILRLRTRIYGRNDTYIDYS